MSLRSSWLVLALAVTSCGQVAVGTDAGAADASVDSGVDAGLVDAGAADAGEVDGGDAGLADAGDDAGLGDAGDDGGSFDAGGQDAGQVDAGEPDAGADAGVDPGFDAGPVVLPDGGLCPSGDGSGAPFRLRAMASNLTSGNLQSYDPGHGQRILQAFAPDIAMMQEFNYGTNSADDVTAFVNATFDGGVDGGFAWYRGIGGQIPNGIISRWPIVDAGDWVDPLVGNRAFTWVQVDLPGPRDVFVVSLHLLTSNAGDRASEARSVISRLVANVPPGDFLLVGGDFNTATRTEQALTEFSARLSTGGPWPVDQAGVGGTNTSRSKPYDWVLASPCLDGLAVPVVVGAQQFGTGLVFDSRVFTPLADVAPVQLGDSAAPSMQHMGVVRDFLISP